MVETTAPASGNPRFPLFDSARALAALSVLVFHAALASAFLQRPLIGPVLQQLKAGVAVFFGISGFLLYRPFVAARFDGRPARRARDYARSRALRIIPAYWAALTAIALWPGLRDVFTARWPIYYFFGQIYWKSTMFNGLVPAWTLCVEITFYAFLPVYAFALRRLGSRTGVSIQRQEFGVILILGLSSIVLRQLVHWHAMPLSLPGNFDWFAIGMALAVINVGSERGLVSPSFVRRLEHVARFSWLVAGALLLISAYFEHTGRSDLAVHVFYGFIGLAFLLPACFANVETTDSVPRKILAQGWLAWLGLISYGIYLWHWRIVFGVARALRNVPHAFPIVVITSALLTIACAAASYYIVERRALAYKSGRRASPAHSEKLPSVTRG